MLPFLVRGGECKSWFNLFFIADLICSNSNCTKKRQIHGCIQSLNNLCCDLEYIAWSSLWYFTHLLVLIITFLLPYFKTWPVAEENIWIECGRTTIVYGLTMCCFFFHLDYTFNQQRHTVFVLNISFVSLRLFD